MAISKIQNESINRSDLTGSVLQTVSMTVATEVSSTSASYVTTNVTKAITPSSNLKLQVKF